MALLPFPLFLKPPGENLDVTPLDKPAGLAAADLAAGVARVGGARHPNYFHAYMHAAAQLINAAEKLGTFDDVGLPIFYLQRHAAELMLKTLLAWCDMLVEQRLHTDPAFVDPVSSGARGRRTQSHSLAQLLADLREVCRGIGVEQTVEAIHAFAVIDALVDTLKTIESAETFARYDSSSSKQGVLQHMAVEVEIPVLAIQEALNSARRLALFDRNTEASLEGLLSELWDRTS